MRSYDPAHTRVRGKWGEHCIYYSKILYFSITHSNSQKYVPIDKGLMASALVRLPILSVLRLAALKLKNSGWCPHTVSIFTLRFTKNASQNGQKETPSEAITALPPLG
jgi:hypothetical protein